MTDDPVAVLRRWAESGAVWRVLSRRGGRVTVGLYECTGGAEVDRIESGDPALLDYLGDRSGSED
ncbi:hypothetical protein IU500_16050 [Nocardia terpenica]|uniref:hypothetical protein n=1 Tax=Nocardia terpenica TaxID=455432 RepID=UPI001895EF59|nr:hypothetical protein [Nocardia terpenica]MBF6061216.1 hypothetical protein [Nocardia terpenica]MBF6105555.1 hypothetical protein [Nocardia terpenica]MBF6112975.1 hypothetical protein [Nocardia terpenica]MBF6119105.1 hypothetical protein [Nocardia terpenica]MBF6152753.1 hypothetical protein [Nocardia terpenica]